MTHKRLPSEIVSLIHHVELNESGWWRKSVSQIIKGIIWRSSIYLSREDIQSAFKEGIGLDIETDKLEKQIQFLMSTKEVMQLQNGKIKLSEQEKTRLDSEILIANSQQEECKRLFKEDIVKCCNGLDPDETWNAFSVQLEKSIRAFGANTLHILTDGNFEQEAGWIEKFIEERPDHKIGLTISIKNMFNPDRKACRSQILRLMSANLFAEASQLGQKTLDAIERKRKNNRISILLDTNLIFSILNLHDNQINSSAAHLIDIANKNKKFIEIKFYVLPGTISEARHSLESNLERIRHIRLNRAVSAAISSYGFSGVASKYFQSERLSPGLSPESFLSPYIESLEIILREKGIIILEEQPESWKNRQEVIDDLLDETRCEESYPPEKRKAYSMVLHDVIFWHVIESRRGKGVLSPMDVDFWGVTADRRLIGFDRRKQNYLSQFPLILYPTNLINFLQFWIPRSEGLEASLIDSLSLPLYFSKFDAEDESAALGVLNAISRFENLDDISESTVTTLLADKVLKSRFMEKKTTEEDGASLVREALIYQLNEKENVLDSKDAQLKEAGNVILNKDELYEREIQKNKALNEKIIYAESKNRLIKANIKYASSVFIITAISCFFTYIVINNYEILGSIFGIFPSVSFVVLLFFTALHFLLVIAMEKGLGLDESSLFVASKKPIRVFSIFFYSVVLLGLGINLYSNSVQKKIDNQDLSSAFGKEKHGSTAVHNPKITQKPPSAESDTDKLIIKKQAAEELINPPSTTGP